MARRVTRAWSGVTSFLVRFQSLTKSLAFHPATFPRLVSQGLTVSDERFASRDAAQRAELPWQVSLVILQQDNLADWKRSKCEIRSIGHIDRVAHGTQCY